MRYTKIYFAAAILLGLIISGFQCSSTELTSARLYMQQKNWDKALEVLQKDVAANPQSDEGFYLMGVVYGETGDIEKMTDAFDKSLAISDKFKKEITENRAYYWAQSFNDGVNLFKRGNQATDPDSAKMFYDKSIESYKKAIILQPDSAETYRNLAFVYLTTGMNEESVEPLQKLVDLEKSEEGYQYLGDVYYALGANKMIDYKNSGNKEDSVEAVNYYNKTITLLEEGKKLYPDNSDMLVTLSNSYIGANKIEVAMTAFEEGVAKEPDNESYRYNYGVLLLGANRFEEAEQQFKKAIELKPDYDNAIYNLAVTYVKWGTEINKKAEEEGKMSDEYKQKYEQALPYLEKVTERDPENGQMWELIGKVYSVLGMQAEAEDAFKKADQLR